MDGHMGCWGWELECTAFHWGSDSGTGKWLDDMYLWQGPGDEWGGDDRIFYDCGELCVGRTLSLVVRIKNEVYSFVCGGIGGSSPNGK